MRRLFAFLILAVIAYAILALPLLSQQTEDRPLINTIRIEGAIEPAAALYVHRSIKAAEDNGAQALIILLETPGGLDDSMRSIVKGFFASRVPIVVYVSPEGARAACLLYTSPSPRDRS